jgi:hypothetical protein
MLPLVNPQQFMRDNLRFPRNINAQTPTAPQAEA